MRSDTTERRQHVKEAALKFMVAQQKFPTSVDISKKLQEMGVEKGAKNLNLLKADLGFVAEDFAQLLIQKEQLEVDGQEYKVPDVVFEMALKFYNQIKDENQKSFDEKLIEHQKQVEQARAAQQQADEKSQLLNQENQKLNQAIHQFSVEKEKFQEKLRELERALTDSEQGRAKLEHDIELLQHELELEKTNQAQQSDQHALALLNLEKAHQEAIKTITLQSESQENRLAKQYDEQRNRAEKLEKEQVKHQVEKAGLSKTIKAIEKENSELKKSLQKQQTLSQAVLAKDKEIELLKSSLKDKDDMLKKILVMKQTMSAPKKKTIKKKSVIRKKVS